VLGALGTGPICNGSRASFVLKTQTNPSDVVRVFVGTDAVPVKGYYVNGDEAIASDANGVQLSSVGQSADFVWNDGAWAWDDTAGGNSASATIFGPLSVTDGLTTVAKVAVINLTSGAVVTAGAAGTADVAITGPSLTAPVITHTGTFDYPYPFILTPPLDYQLGVGASPVVPPAGAWINDFSYAESNPANSITAIDFTNLVGVSGQVGTLVGVTNNPNPGFTPTLSATTFGCADLAFVGGEFGPTLLNLVAPSFPNLAFVGANFNPIFNADASVDFSSLAMIGGSFNPGFGPGDTDISFPALATVAGSFTPTFGGSETTISFPSLASTGQFTVSTTATTIDFSALQTIGGAFGSSFVASAATALNLAALTHVNSDFDIEGASLTSIALTSLATVTGIFGLSAGADSIATLSLPAMTDVGGISFGGATALATLDFPALVNIGATGINFATGTGALTDFSVGSGLLSCAGDVDMTSCALDVASVNALLVAFAALDGTGGTTLYTGHNVTITGSSASPTGVGVTAKATLITNGNTVTTN